jgi:hypothetical protein
MPSSRTRYLGFLFARLGVCDLTIWLGHAIDSRSRGGEQTAEFLSEAPCELS